MMSGAARRLAACVGLICLYLFAACGSEPPAVEPEPCPDGSVRTDAGSCEPRGCAPEDCARGVCGPDDDCVNAANCTGEAQCLEGYFCGDDAACVRDRCAGGQDACTRGRCERVSGECVEVEPCGSSLDCFEGRSCLEEACTANDELCGEDGCSGDLICDFDEQAGAAECVEPEECVDARDCLEGRVCSGRHCLGAPACEADVAEPNDTVETAGDFGLFSHFDTLDATLCEGDRDVFAVELDDATVRSHLRVSLEFPRREIGLGPVRVDLVGDGTTLATETTDERDELHFEKLVPVPEPESLSVVVSAPEGVGAGGIHYQLTVTEFLPDQMESECGEATTIQAGATAGDTTGASTTPLGSRCATEIGGGAEIYSFSVEQKSLLSVELEAEVDTSFLVALREQCPRMHTETACGVVSGGDIAAVRGGLDDQLVEPGEYFVIVQSPTPEDEGEFTLYLDLEPAQCTGADDHCLDSATARLCDASGDGFTEQSCEGGCEMHTGSCRADPGDVCSSAPLVTQSTSLSVDWSEFGDDYAMPDEQCLADPSAPEQTHGPDAVWRIGLPANHLFRAELSDGNGERSALYLVDDCMAVEERCVASVQQQGDQQQSDGPESLTYWNDDSAPRTLFLVADSDLVGSEPLDAAPAALDITIEPIACGLWEYRCLGDDLQICNDLRTDWAHEETCTRGCVDKDCVPPPGDTCDIAEPLADGDTYSGNFGEYTSNIDSDLSRCTAQLPGPQTPHPGPDVFYEVSMRAGEVLDATIDTAAEGVSLYVADTCRRPDDHCLWGVDNADELEFYAPKTGIYYLVVDAPEATDESFEVSVDIASGQAVCQPGGATCNPFSDRLVECSDDGTEERVEYDCQGGCQGQLCDQPDELFEACQNLQPLPRDTRMIDDFENYLRNIDGVHIVYPVDVSAGEVLDARIYASDTELPSLSLTDDCSESAEDHFMHEGGFSDEAALRYQSPIDQTLYLVAHGGGDPQGDSRFLLETTVQPAECQSGDVFCATSGDSRLRHCVEGRLDDYACPAGCTAEGCANPRGDICWDALPINSDQTVIGDFSGSDALELEPTPGTACSLEIGEVNGPETFYRVELQPGELVEAELLSSEQSATLYLVEDCESSTECVPSRREATSRTLRHVSDSGGRYYVVVDSEAGRPSPGRYQLSFEFTASAACAPGDYYCEDANTLGRCDETGSQSVSSSVCPAGCSDGACEPDVANADTCAGAPIVESGFSTYIDFTALTDDTDPDSPCTNRNANGTDAAYAIDVDADEVLHVRTSNEHTVTVLTDCSSPDSSCVAGTDTPSYFVNQDIWWSPDADTTATVVVHGGYRASRYGQLSIETVPVACTPGAKRCSPGGGAVQSCNEHGLLEEAPCTTGCAQQGCIVPSGEHCADAIPVNGSQTVSGNLGEYVPSEFETQALGPWFFYGGGRNVVYAVDLADGDTLDARLATADDSASMILFESCHGLAARDWVATSTGNRLNYAAPEAGTYFLVLAAPYFPTDDFAIDIDIGDPPPACSPGLSHCVDGSTREYCDAGVTRTETCRFGCTNGACNPVQDDQCSGATTVARDGELHSYEIDLSEYSDDYDLATGSSAMCRSLTLDGPDAVFQLDAEQGDIFTASWFPDGVAGWLVDNCSSAASHCLRDVRTSGNGLRHIIPADGTYWFILDSAAGDPLPDPLELDMKLEPRICQPGQRSCTGTPGVMEYCDQTGTEWKDYHCDGGCDDSSGTPVCGSPRGESCVDAIDATGGGLYATQPHTFRDTFDGYFMSCGGPYLNPGDLNGGDAIYRLDLLAGQRVRARLGAQGTASSRDLALYLLDDCFLDQPTMAGRCLAGDHDSSASSIDWTTPSDQTVYLVVDNESHPLVEE
ncbi:MAG: PPC domain-containing protein, partial [Persicimonas sp.]